MSTDQIIKNAQETAALAETYWTHKGTGGWFEVIIVGTGQGSLALNGQIVVYRRAATHEVYARTLDSWQKHMIPADTKETPKHWQDD